MGDPLERTYEKFLQYVSCMDGGEIAEYTRSEFEHAVEDLVCEARIRCGGIRVLRPQAQDSEHVPVEPSPDVE